MTALNRQPRPCRVSTARCSSGESGGGEASRLAMVPSLPNRAGRAMRTVQDLRTVDRAQKAGTFGRMQGKLIALEGIDGSGTTTQTRALADALAKRGHRVRPTCEPTETSTGKA